MQICQSTSQLVAGSNSVADPLKSAEGLLAQRLARYRLILTEDLSNIIQSSAFVFFFSFANKCSQHRKSRLCLVLKRCMGYLTLQVHEIPDT